MGRVQKNNFAALQDLVIELKEPVMLEAQVQDIGDNITDEKAKNGNNEACRNRNEEPRNDITKDEEVERKIEEEVRMDNTEDSPVEYILYRDTDFQKYRKASFKNEENLLRILNSKPLLRKLEWKETMTTKFSNTSLTAYDSEDHVTTPMEKENMDENYKTLENKEKTFTSSSTRNYNTKSYNDIIMKPSDEEIRELNKELHLVNESCSNRLGHNRRRKRTGWK
ncbi:hypothetical protein RclHR1_00370005 [Rhizophagus clarus]|uniref:Uncharacterized protein n=1 Tax=Rhizophagus clarus TaxID=94130 RepID=A0A2Z6RP18_9GLOM|nr:hypothetical protein RclHR1_00370005 [Rhizophagus clarus]